MLIRKSLAAWVAALFVLCAQITSAQATLLSIPTAQADKIEHGGGCRKDSTGTVLPCRVSALSLPLRPALVDF